VSRHWLPRWPAVLVALLFVVAPEIARWGRQVMLEIPAYAFLLWSVYLILRYADRGERPALWLSAALLLLAAYTKQTVIFILPAYALLLLPSWRQAGALRTALLVGTIFAICMVPLLILLFKFGQGNIQSVSGIGDAIVPRNSLAAWVWYLRQLPDQLGW